MKTKLLSFLVVLMAFVMVANAQDFVIADFEDKAVGDTYPTWQPWGDEVNGTATVVSDPSGKINKTVNLVTTNYDCMFQVETTLPEGKTLGDYLAVSFDIYSPTQIWKCMFIYIDGVRVFRNEKEDKDGNMVDDYIFQAAGETWTTKTYSLSTLNLTPEDLAKTSFTIAMGPSDNAGNFYFDNIKLIAPKTSEGGYLVLENFEGKSINDSYAVQTYGEGQAVATIIADPEDSNNKVVNLVTSGWDPRVKVDVILPEGKTLGDYEAILADIYFPTNPNDEWSNHKQFVISIDANFIYKVDGYPKLGDMNAWSTMTYPLSETTVTDEQKAKSSFSLEMGVNADNANYHMDNIMLKEKGTGLVQNIVKAIMVAVQNGKLLIQGDNVTKVDVYDSKGMHCTSVKNESTVDISALDKGIYIVKVQTESGTFTNKVIK